MSLPRSSAAAASVFSGRVTQRTANSVTAQTTINNTARLTSKRYGQLITSCGRRASSVTAVPSARRVCTTNDSTANGRMPPASLGGDTPPSPGGLP